ncbi:proline iminopeptidase [Hysterangium stoloniferum]|nr:proline iminopeptidase [Hysterangium stoloniferum]
MTSPAPKVTEGEAEFHVAAAGKPCKTWYKVVGDVGSKKRPLVILHGGPGASHDYLLSISALATTHEIPVVFYDQIGSGRSTHLPEKKGDGAFWTDQLFCDELDNLVRHLGIQDDFAILGHSWGGMLGARYATSQPKGLNKLILANSPASMELFVQAANKLKKGLPQDVQDTLTRHEDAGTTDSKEYEAATMAFYKLYMCRLETWPDELNAAFEWLAKDPTVYHTMNGPNEFHVIGTLKTWSIIDRLHNINVSTLVLNGYYDESQDETVQPLFNNIPKCKWVQFANSSHMPHLEETVRYLDIVGNFLA